MSTNYSQIQKILASDPSAGDYFGQAVALSTSGHVVLVGRPHSSDISTSSPVGAGAASVFRFRQSDAQWVDQFEFAANTPVNGDLFGWSAAISAHGLVAVIGAPQSGGSGNGGACIFVDSDTFWIQQTGLFASDGQPGDQFGASVATSAQGHTVLVGAPNAKIGAFSNQGAVYIFQFNGVSWVPQQKIDDIQTGQGNLFGTAVAMSLADDDTALIGATQQTGGNRGLAYIFTRTGITWTEQQTIQNPNVSGGANFGVSVALSGSGPTQIALVGANLDTIGSNSQQGAAYVFMRSDGTWPLQQQLLASDGVANDQFGSSVALGISPEGYDIALIGAAGGNKAYVFKHVSNVWTPFQEITASDSALSVNFGNAVTLTGDGSKGLIGASAFNSNQGGAYLFGAPHSVTAAPGTNNTLISFLPDILITTIVLYGGIVSMFLFNASEE